MHRTLSLRMALASALLLALCGCAKPVERAAAVALTEDATFVLVGDDLYGAGPSMTAPKVLWGVKWLTMSDPGPQIVAGRVKAIAGYGPVRAVLDSAGRVARFRLAPNEKGELAPKLFPVEGITNATAVAADNVRACALSADDSVRCFKLDGDDLDLRAVRTEGVTGIAEIAVSDHAVPLRTNGGALWVAWDAPRTIEDRGTTPKPAKLGDGCTRLHRDPGGVAAVFGDGTIKKGRFNGEDFELHTQPLLQGAKDVALSTEFQCALFDKDGRGEVRCAGANDGGQLGDGTNASRATYTPVLDLEAPTAIAVSPTVQSGGKYLGHACAIVAGGKVRCWGGGEHGELGDMKDASSTKATTFKTP